MGACGSKDRVPSNCAQRRRCPEFCPEQKQGHPKRNPLILSADYKWRLWAVLKSLFSKNRLCRICSRIFLSKHICFPKTILGHNTFVNPIILFYYLYIIICVDAEVDRGKNRKQKREGKKECGGKLGMKQTHWVCWVLTKYTQTIYVQFKVFCRYTTIPIVGSIRYLFIHRRMPNCVINYSIIVVIE